MKFRAGQPTFLFDFDGTIADTMNALADIYNSVIAPAFGSQPINDRDRELLRGANPRSLIKMYHVPLLKLPIMVRRARKELFRRIDTVKPHGNMVAALHELHSAGFYVGILTSNSRENVRRFLAHWGAEKTVDFIHTGLHVFGKHRQMKGILKKRKLKPGDMVYVGDETRDVEAAKKAGIRVAAVAWGFNTPEALEKTNPDRLIRDAGELLKWGQELFPEHAQK